MRLSDCVGCAKFPCQDVNHERYSVPAIEVKPAAIRLVMIAESAAPDPKDNFYSPGEPLFAQTTVAAFRDAGAEVSSARDILARGVYLTTAVKCAKNAYGIETGTVEECSRLLERELAMFPKLKALMLMGDTAIRALNAIARRAGEKRVIPAGSTYKLRAGEYRFRGARVFPSYLQAGPAFFIEKSKRRMIAEDLGEALRITRNT